MSGAEEIRRALHALGTDEVRSGLAAMGEDAALIERYLASDLPSVRQKGLDRVREAESRLRRGPTPYTVNTRLRLYEPIALKVRRAALQRALEQHGGFSAHAAMLLVDLGTWVEVAIEPHYTEALEELSRAGLAERRPPLPHDPDQRPRVAATAFVEEVMRQIGPLAVLDAIDKKEKEARRAENAAAPSRRTRGARRG